MSLFYAQGWESLRDSLLIENERIETLELEQRPLPEPPRMERPVWRLKSAVWEGVPELAIYTPAPVQPTRPSWTKLAPLHVRYGVGRYWTQTVDASWGRTRDLSADEGISLTHASTPMGHVSQARWGHTHLSGWVGRYTDRSGWEAAYRGGYEKFIYYAPYAEGWEGFDAKAPVLDSLQGHYFRQELRLRAFERDIGELNFRTRRLDFRKGTPEWQAFLSGKTRRYAVRGWQGIGEADAFVEGGRFLVGLRAVAERVYASWEIRAGVRLAAGQDSAFRFLGAPALRGIYTGFGSFFRPCLQLEGDLRPLTYFAASEINPYLRREATRLPLIREWLHARLGWQGQGTGWDYSLAAEYRLQQGAPVFVPGGAAFSLRGIPTFQSIGASLQVAYMPLPTGPYLELRGSYRSWQASETYYSLAPWEIWFRGGYRLSDRFMINLSAYGIGRRTLAPGVEAPPFVDISWEAHAQILPFLSIFAEMNNLLNRRFYRWYAYVERPLDFRLGIWIKLG